MKKSGDLYTSLIHGHFTAKIILFNNLAKQGKQFLITFTDRMREAYVDKK